MTKIKIKCNKKQASEHIAAVNKVFTIIEKHSHSCPITQTVTFYIKAEIKEVKPS